MTFLSWDNGAIQNADEAAAAVLHQAMQAAAQGTFAVGGCLLENATGRLLHAVHNNVLKPLAGAGKAFIYDPTAHGERQLVDWYYAHKDELSLPEPHELTVVTTLDPCVMCTGALLAAGFNVGILASDVFAGINYDETFTFNALPFDLRAAAKAKFGYYACGHPEQDPSTDVRRYIGGKDVAFRQTGVSAQRLMESRDLFQTSAIAIRQNISEAGLGPHELSDPATLPDDSPIKVRFRAIDPAAFTLKLPVARSPVVRLPDAQLYHRLVAVKATEPRAQNAVALIDPFGNVVLCLPDRFDRSPVRTAFMNVTRAYAIARFDLANNPTTRRQASRYLTHPKYGTFAFLHAPNPNDATTLITLGAYGSTMEGPVPERVSKNFQYFQPPLEGTIEELRDAIANLPPFYTQLVQISLSQCQ